MALASCAEALAILVSSISQFLISYLSPQLGVFCLRRSVRMYNRISLAELNLRYQVNNVARARDSRICSGERSERAKQSAAENRTAELGGKGGFCTILFS